VHAHRPVPVPLQGVAPRVAGDPPATHWLPPAQPQALGVGAESPPGHPNGVFPGEQNPLPSTPWWWASASAATGCLPPGRGKAAEASAFPPIDRKMDRHFGPGCVRREAASRVYVHTASAICRYLSILLLAQ
jgi:hypothetical protein